VVDETGVYVHVAGDGGILVVDGESGLSSWVTMRDLLGKLVESWRGRTLIVNRSEQSTLGFPVIEAILASGADVMETDQVHPDAIRPGDTTALMAFSYAGAVEFVKDLIQRGASVDSSDDRGYTALMYACNAGQEAIVRMLLEAGGDPNISDIEGSTSLMFASQWGYSSIVKLLLSAGADPTLARPDGLLPRDFAAQRGHQQLANLLLSAELQRQP